MNSSHDLNDYIHFLDRVCTGEGLSVLDVILRGHSTIAPLTRSSSPNLSGYHVFPPIWTISSIDTTTFPSLSGCPWITVCSGSNLPIAQILPSLHLTKIFSEDCASIGTLGSGLVTVAVVVDETAGNVFLVKVPVMVAVVAMVEVGVAALEGAEVVVAVVIVVVGVVDIALGVLQKSSAVL